MKKPIRIVFTTDGKPRQVGGRPDEKLWTAWGGHWLKSDGPFPYHDCETRYIERDGAASILEATPS